MKVKNIKIYLILLGIFLIPFYVQAESIDIARQSTITGSYTYGTINISDANCYIYKIANYNSDESYTYLDSYNEYSDIDIKTLTTSNLKDLATKINKTIEDNKINYDFITNTDESGNFSISGLSVGLYLIKTDDKKIGDYIYSTTPALLSIPTTNLIDGNYVYDLSIAMKSEAKYTQSKKTYKENIKNVDSGPKSDETGLIEYFPALIKSKNVYSLVLLIVFIILIISIIYVYMKYKKRKNKEASYEEE